MKHWIWVFILGFALGATACGKKEEQKPAPEQPAAPTSPAEPTTSPAPSQ